MWPRGEVLLTPHRLASQSMCRRVTPSGRTISLMDRCAKRLALVLKQDRRVRFGDNAAFLRQRAPADSTQGAARVRAKCARRAPISTHPIDARVARAVRLHVTTAQTATDTVAARSHEREAFGTSL
jgi:hypothetical protein